MSVKVTHLGGSSYEIRSEDTSLIVSIPVTQDAPRSGLRPSQMLLAALGACMLSTGVEFLHGQGQETSGSALELDYELASRPMRISKVNTTVTLPNGLSEAQTGQFNRSIARCAIHNTLHHSVEVEVAVPSEEG